MTRLAALLPGLPGWASTRKVKPIWILLKQETVSGSGINWAICKSAPRSRQPRQHQTAQFFTGRMPFLPPKQQCQSTEGLQLTALNWQLYTQKSHEQVCFEPCPSALNNTMLPTWCCWAWVLHTGYRLISPVGACAHQQESARKSQKAYYHFRF